MSKLFAWRIVVKVERVIVEGPVTATTQPVTGELIGYAIRDIFNQVEKLNVPANEVDMLGFAAALENDKDGYYEPLDPYVFWPNPPEILGREYRNIVRDTKASTEGGEN